MDENTQPSSEQVTNQETPQSATEPKKKKGKKKLLLVLFLLVLLALLCCAVVVGGAYILKEQEKDEDQETQEEENEEEKEVTPPQVKEQEVYAVANCKFYQLFKGKAIEINMDDKTNTECFANITFAGSYAFIKPEINPVEDQRVEDLYLADMTTKAVSKVETNYQGWTVADFDRGSQKIYTYILNADGTAKEGFVYEGTVTQPLQKKIINLGGEILGRGIGPSDNVSLRLNPDKTKLLIQDTFSSPKAGNTTFKNLQVINLQGQILYSVNGSFAKWVDDKNIVYVADGKVEVYNLTTKAKRTIYTSNEGGVFNIQVFEGKIVIDQLDDNVSDTVVSTTSVYDYKTAGKIADLPKNLSFSLFLSEDVVISHKSFECKGDPFEGSAIYPCPADAPFSHYEESIDSLVVESGDSINLIKYAKPSFADPKVV